MALAKTTRRCTLCLLLLLGGCAPIQSAENSPLVTVPPRIDLGTLRPGEGRTILATIRNAGNATKSIDRIETSCPCVTAAIEGSTIAAGSSLPLKIVFNPADEPDFRGSLSVEITAYDKDRPVLKTSADLTVAQSETAN